LNKKQTENINQKIILNCILIYLCFFIVIFFLNYCINNYNLCLCFFYHSKCVDFCVYLRSTDRTHATKNINNTLLNHQNYGVIFSPSSDIRGNIIFLRGSLALVYFRRWFRCVSVSVSLLSPLLQVIVCVLLFCVCRAPQEVS